MYVERAFILKKIPGNSVNISYQFHRFFPAVQIIMGLHLITGHWSLPQGYTVSIKVFSIRLNMMTPAIKMSSVIDLIDIAYALMAIPNIIATVVLALIVREKLKEYNLKYKV